MKTVEIYSTPACHFCHQTKEFLKEHGVPFTDYDVSTDLEKRQAMIDLTGQMGVPVVVIGEDVMIGFEKAKLSELLDIQE